MVLHIGDKIEIHSRVIQNRGEEQQAIIDILEKIYTTLEKIDLENQSGAKKSFIFSPMSLQRLLIYNRHWREVLKISPTSNIILQFARMFPPDDFMPEPEFKGVNHLSWLLSSTCHTRCFALPIRVSYDIAKSKSNH